MPIRSDRHVQEAQERLGVALGAFFIGGKAKRGPALEAVVDRLGGLAPSGSDDLIIRSDRRSRRRALELLATARRKADHTRPASPDLTSSVSVDEKVIHRVLEEETMSFHPLEGFGRERVGAPDLLTPCPMGHRSTTLDR